MRADAMELKEICHQVRNGLLVIRGLCLQVQRGNMAPEIAFEQIQQRCLSIEAALEGEHDEAGIHHHPS